MTTGAGHGAYVVLSVVMFTSLVAPVLAPALSAAVLLDAVCSRGLTYRHAAASIGCLAIFIYGCGSWSSHIWDFRGAAEYCGGDLARAPAARLIPLAHTCYMADGTTHQLVSPLVDPALLACLVGGTAIVVIGRRRAARQRRSRGTDSPFRA